MYPRKEALFGQNNEGTESWTISFKDEFTEPVGAHGDHSHHNKGSHLDVNTR